MNFQSEPNDTSSEKILIAYNPTLTLINHLSFQSNTSNITLQKLVNGVFESHIAVAIKKKSGFEISLTTELAPLEMAVYKIIQASNPI